MSDFDLGFSFFFLCQKGKLLESIYYPFFTIHPIQIRTYITDLIHVSEVNVLIYGSMGKLFISIIKI